MLSAPGATPTLEELLSPYELLGEIGTRPTPLYAVKHLAYGGKAKLLVAERFEGAAGVGNAEAAAFMADARRLSTLASPNVGRVREVAVRGDDLFVFWDFVDGDKLERSWLSPELSLDLAVRFILDVLAGAGAIHGLRDARQKPMQLAHGEISPATVLVGIDGAARLMHAVARRVPGGPAEAASQGYLAPEIHMGEGYDARADVFSVGVLLWEALSGARLFADDEPAAIVSRVKGSIARAATCDSTRWASGLVQVAAKALAFSPADRWSSASAMAAEIRKAAGLKLASASAASAFAKGATGPRAAERRQRLESGICAAPPPPPSERTPEPVAQSVDPPTASHSAGATPLPAVALELSAPELPPVVPAVTASVSPAPLDIDPDKDVELLPDSLPPAASRAPVPPMAVMPPLPARALPPPDLSHEMELAISVAPPPVASYPATADSDAAWPTSVGRADKQHDRATRRRRATVLAGVGAFGLLVFAFAGWRAAHRVPASSIPASTLAAPATLAADVGVTAAKTTPDTTRDTTSEPKTAGSPETPPAIPHAATTSPPIQTAAPPHPATPAGVAVKPSASAAASPKKKTPATPSRPAKTHHSGFDPNSL